MKMNVKHNYSLDIMRMFLAVLVILGHSTYYEVTTPFGGIAYETLMNDAGIDDTVIHTIFGHLTTFIYTFHMPCFISISGFLFGKQINDKRFINFKDLVKTKFIRLLVPMLFVHIVWNIPIKWISGYYSESSIKDALIQIIFPENLYLWYCESLFFCFIFAWILVRYIKNPIPQIIIVSIGWIVQRVIFSYGGGYTLFGQPLKFLPWFFMGMYIPKIKAYLSNIKLWGKTGIAVGLALYTIFFILFIVLPVKNWIFGQIFLPAIAILIIWCLCDKYKRDNERIKLTASYSYGLYLWSEPINYLILWIAYSLFGISAFGTEIGAFVIICARIIVSSLIGLLITKLLKKYNFPIKAY